jgi:protein-S-isoprenylcysteine O-methyltransferase Ste14
MNKIVIPPVFVLISVILIMFFYFYLPQYNLIRFPYNLPGLIVIFSGFVLVGKVWELFKKHKTTLEFEESAVMITEGMFSKSRNPMYIGMFMLLCGLAMCFGNLFSLLTPVGFILLIRFLFIPKEERLMENKFGEKYLLYKQKVRRWL